MNEIINALFPALPWILILGQHLLLMLNTPFALGSVFGCVITILFFLIKKEVN